jgi:hypothetical protein
MTADLYYYRGFSWSGWEDRVWIANAELNIK